LGGAANSAENGGTTPPRKTQELDKIIHRRTNTGMDMTLERQRLSEQWDVEMLTLAREVKAEIDTKIVALQWMIADANQVMAEMERKIRSAAPNETVNRLSSHIHADSVAVNAATDFHAPNRAILTSDTASDIENIQNMTVPDPFADVDFGLTKAIQELDRISTKIPPFEQMETLGQHENRQVCPVSEQTFHSREEPLELPPMIPPPMVRSSPVPVSRTVAPPLNTPVSQYEAISAVDRDSDRTPNRADGYAGGDVDGGYATTIRFPGSGFPDNAGVADRTAAAGAVADLSPWNTDISQEDISTQNGEKFLKIDTEALQRRAVAQDRRLSSIPTAVSQGQWNHSQKQLSDRTPTDQAYDGKEMIIRGLFPERRTINISHVGGPKLSPSSKILAQPAPKFESLTVADKENVKRMGSIPHHSSQDEKSDKNNDVNNGVNMTAAIPQNRKPNAKSFLVESEPYLRREVPELGVRTAKRHQVLHLSEQGISSREIAARIEMPVGEVELILSLHKRMHDDRMHNDRQKKQQFPGRKNNRTNEPLKLTGRIIGGRKTEYSEKRPENNASHENSREKRPQ